MGISKSSPANPSRKRTTGRATAKKTSTIKIIEEDDDDWDIKTLVIGIEKWDYASNIWSYENDAIYQRCSVIIEGTFLEPYEFQGSAVEILITPSNSIVDNRLARKCSFNTFGAISLPDDDTDKLSISIDFPKEYWSDFFVILTSGNLKIAALEAVWNPKEPYISRFSVHTKYTDPA